jgi:hypothetical protein
MVRDCCAVVEAQDPHGMVPTSTSSIYKVFDNIHMLWMGRWIHRHAVTTTLVDPELENFDQNPEMKLHCKPYQLLDIDR